MLSEDELAVIARARLFLDENLAHMTEIATASSYAAFANDWRLMAAGQRLVQTAVEALMDIARPLARQYAVARSGSGREALLLLQERGLLPLDEGLVNRMTSMRNRLVHNYADVDAATVYAVCARHRDDISGALAALMQLAAQLSPPLPGAEDQGVP